MAHVTAELDPDLLVHLRQIVIFVGFFTGPFRQVRQDTLQVLDPIFTCLHAVVTQVLRLRAGILVVSFSAKP